MIKKPFWEYALLAKTHGFEITWAAGGLGEKALNERETFYTTRFDGSLTENISIQEALDFIQNLQPKSFIAFRSMPRNQLKDIATGDENWFVIDEDLAIDIDYTHKNRETAFNVFALKLETLESIRAFCKRHLTRKVTKGRVYVVVQDPEGPVLEELGVAGETFIESNYRPEVVEQYRHIVKDLNSKNPCGMVSILDGPAGTGKTHMVRALLNEVPKATFVLVPSNMMSTLGSPNFVRVLLRERRPGHPLILVIEDADECLSSRKTDNISEISALLNFSDGIFGSQIDIRVLATTNVDAGDLDPAVMRDGRLCRRIEVGKLDWEQANVVYSRLNGERESPFTRGNFYTLAEVYRYARGDSDSQISTKRLAAKGRVGFTMDRDISIKKSLHLHDDGSVTVDGKKLDVIVGNVHVEGNKLVVDQEPPDEDEYELPGPEYYVEYDDEDDDDDEED